MNCINRHGYDIHNNYISLLGSMEILTVAKLTESVNAAQSFRSLAKVGKKQGKVVDKVDD